MRTLVKADIQNSKSAGNRVARAFNSMTSADSSIRAGSVEAQPGTEESAPPCRPVPVQTPRRSFGLRWRQCWSSRLCAIIGAALAVLALGGCRPSAQPPTAPEAQVSGDTIVMATNSPQLSALAIEPAGEPPPATVPLTGRLMWDGNATARVFTPFGGIVRKLLVDVNQPVTNGMALAEIQSADFGQAQADARKAESAFRLAERNRDRLRELFAHGATPRKDVESAEADYASAQAESDRASERLAIYGATSDSPAQIFRMPSPLDGILVEKNVTAGQEVRPDQMLANAPELYSPLFVVSDPSHLWLQIDATEVDLPHLQPGSQFTFTSRAFPGQSFAGRVDVVSDFIDPTTRTIKVRGTVDNSRGFLKAEMFVNVNLPADDPPGASVPSKAVFLDGEQHYIFVEEQPQRFVRRKVTLGPEREGRVILRDGVKPGQRVVTDGCLLLEQMMK